MTMHELKIWPVYYAAILSGQKRFEARWGDDRQYAVGDRLVLREWNPVDQAYTGRRLGATVAYVERVSGRQLGQGADEVLWLMGLADDVFQGVDDGGLPAHAEPTRIDLGLAPEGVTTFEGWETWPTWIPVGAVHIEAAGEGVPVLMAQNRSVMLCRIPFSGADGAMIAWVKMSEYTVNKGRWCVLRSRRGVVEGPQDVQTFPLTHAWVVRTKLGKGVDLFSEVDIVGIVPVGVTL